MWVPIFHMKKREEAEYMLTYVVSFTSRAAKPQPWLPQNAVLTTASAAPLLCLPFQGLRRCLLF